MPLLAAALLLGAASPAAAVTPESVTLEQAIEAALATNPGIDAVDARLKAAEARVSQANGALLPTVTLSGTWATGRLDPGGYFGLAAADVQPRAAVATLEQPLFAGGRILAGREAARAARGSAMAAAELVRAQLSAEVAASFAAVVTARREVHLRERQLAEVREIERQAVVRFRAGDAPSTDVAQAQARAAGAEAGLASARAAEAGAAARFRVLTSLAPLNLGAIPTPPATAASRDEAVTQALAHSPALAAADGAALAAEAQAKAARADWLPTVAGFAEGSTARDQFFPGYRGDQAVVGVRARWVLFDGARMGRIDEARASASAARADASAARREIEAETIAAYEGLAAARLMAEATLRQQQAASEALRSTRLEVKTGMKPQLALLDAERESLDADVAAARAEGGLLVAGWRLKALTG